MIRLSILAVLGSALSAAAQSPGTFAAAGNMIIARVGHTATLLKDGRVLIAGGMGVSAAELYDPSTGTFSYTGSMSTPRWNHTATLLNDGRVLVAGGGTADLYDPATGIFTPTGNMVTLEGQTATLLGNGKVLISRGTVGNSQAAAPELYDPVTGAFKPTGDADQSKLQSTATLLRDGKVFLAGGFPFGDASLYDPANGAFTFVDYFRFWSHSATALANGSVLIAGGIDDDGEGQSAIGTAQIFDPSLKSFKPTGSLLEARDSQTATLLPSGLVLIAGGDWMSYRIYASAELYDPAAGAFLQTGAMTENRTGHTATLLLDGRVLIAGGHGAWSLIPGTGRATYETSQTAELYIPPVRIVSNTDSNRAAGYALRLEADGRQTVLSVQNTIVLDDRPAYLIAYATGIRNRSSLANVHCTIGGISVPVEYAGSEGSGVPGLDQVNLRLTPALKGLGVANLVLSVDGFPSNTVSVDIR